MKIGIGEKPPRFDLADYVLSRFSDDDRKLIDEAAKKASEAIPLIIHGELDEAMNKFNG